MNIIENLKKINKWFVVIISTISILTIRIINRYKKINLNRINSDRRIQEKFLEIFRKIDNQTLKKNELTAKLNNLKFLINAKSVKIGEDLKLNKDITDDIKKNINNRINVETNRGLKFRFLSERIKSKALSEIIELKTNEYKNKRCDSNKKKSNVEAMNVACQLLAIIAIGYVWTKVPDSINMGNSLIELFSNENSIISQLNGGDESLILEKYGIKNVELRYIKNTRILPTSSIKAISNQSIIMK